MARINDAWPIESAKNGRNSLFGCVRCHFSSPQPQQQHADRSAIHRHADEWWWVGPINSSIATLDPKGVRCDTAACNSLWRTPFGSIAAAYPCASLAANILATKISDLRYKPYGTPGNPSGNMPTDRQFTGMPAVGLDWCLSVSRRNG